MLKYTTSQFAILILAACQSAAPEPQSTGAWRTQLESSQADLEREVQALHSLLAVQRPQPASSTELTSGIVALGDRLDQLGALIADATGAHVASAAYSRSSAGAVPPPEIELLKEALLVLEDQRTVHFENIANAGVPGYKRRRLHPSTRVDGPDGLRVPESSSPGYEMQQGVLELTGNQLDFAVQGEGFFEIELPNGDLRYTRTGTFRSDVNGRLVTPEGFPLSDQVAIPSHSQGINASSEGQVYSLSDQNELSYIATIRLHTFANPNGLHDMGRNLYAQTISSGQSQRRKPGAQGAAKIKQGYLERSNVTLTDEVISLQLLERQSAALRQALAGLGVYVL